MLVRKNIFGDEFVAEIEDVKMPYTKFQLLCKLVAKAIKAYSRTNKIQADKFEKMLEETIDDYNNRDKLTFTNEVTQGVVDGVVGIVEDKVNALSDRLVQILQNLKTDSEKFKELGITFEEKAFFDVLTEVRDTHQFEYPDERCIELAKKIKLLIDDTAVYADWLNNDNLKGELASELTVLIYKEGYPPEWDEEVFEKVLKQVENYKKNVYIDKGAGSSKKSAGKKAQEIQMIPNGSMLEDVEADDDVRKLVHNMMELYEGTTIMNIVVEFQKEYQERYFSMKANDWRHLIGDYVRKVTERPDLQENEVFRYVMAG